MGARYPRPPRVPAAHGRGRREAPSRARAAVSCGRQLRPVISTYTRRELMVVAAAREIHDREVVFVGMRLPLLGFGLAKATHAPSAVGLFENGVIRDRPAEAFIYTMGDPPNIAGAVACLGLNDVMSLLQQGRGGGGFLGGGEIDPLGNLNTPRTSRGGGP